jgi:predicted RNA binding protein YcfA (HicA-like mRNA interferase family)
LGFEITDNNGSSHQKFKHANGKSIIIVANRDLYKYSIVDMLDILDYMEVGDDV